MLRAELADNTWKISRIPAEFAKFVIFAKMAAPIIAINFKLLWPFLALFQRMAKMQISSEDGIKKYALHTKLWPK